MTAKARFCLVRPKDLGAIEGKRWEGLAPPVNSLSRLRRQRLPAGITKTEMTLDCLLNSQPRVISVHSWYLTSFGYPHFLKFLLPCPRPHTRLLPTSLMRTPLCQLLRLLAKGERLMAFLSLLTRYPSLPCLLPLVGIYIKALRSLCVSRFSIAARISTFTRLGKPMAYLYIGVSSLKFCLLELTCSLDCPPCFLRL